MKRFFLGFVTVVLIAAMSLIPVLTASAATAKIGMVTDIGGIDDKSFNATSWDGVRQAVDNLGIDGRYLESQQQTDYAKNIQEFVAQDYDLIVTVGFLLGDATQQFAKANSDQKFAIVDYSYNPAMDNVLGMEFSTDQAAFLAGYVAAGSTETGVVGTFGGLPIPPVTIFMKGFEAGIKYYNDKNGTDVQLLGWNSQADKGLFVGNFESTDDGRRMAESLFDEGADIVMPVAGPVGLGSAAAAQARGMKIVGVDTDWYVSAPEFKGTYLTSVMKNMDVAVYTAIKQVVDGQFQGGTYVGTLTNEGVGLAPFHAYDNAVSASLKADVEALRDALISGEITVDGVLGL